MISIYSEQVKSIIHKNHSYLRVNDTSKIINDLANLIFSYVHNYRLVIVLGDASIPLTFTFDANSHLKNTDSEIINTDGASLIKFTNTDNSNDDLLKIESQKTSTSSQGLRTTDYDISIYRLAHKLNILQLVSEVTQFTSCITFRYFLSRHLINKWNQVITIHDEQGRVQTPIGLISQYLHALVANYYFSTMWHLNNTQNTYTITSSGCI